MAADTSLIESYNWWNQYFTQLLQSVYCYNHQAYVVLQWNHNVNLTHSPPEVPTDLGRPEKISFLRHSHSSKIQRSKSFSRIMIVSLLSLSHHKVQRKRWKCDVFLFRGRRRIYIRNCKTLRCLRWNGSIICNFCTITICSVLFQFSPFKHAEDVRIADKTAAPQCCNTQEQNLQCSSLKTWGYKKPAYHSRTYFHFSPIKYTVLNLAQRNINILTIFTLGYGHRSRFISIQKNKELRFDRRVLRKMTVAQIFKNFSYFLGNEVLLSTYKFETLDFNVNCFSFREAPKLCQIALFSRYVFPLTWLKM
jgi:hypothetical protein